MCYPLTAMIATSSASSVSAAWNQDNQGDWNWKEDNKEVTGWKQIDNMIYYYRYILKSKNWKGQPFMQRILGYMRKAIHEFDLIQDIVMPQRNFIALIFFCCFVQCASAHSGA